MFYTPLILEYSDFDRVFIFYVDGSKQRGYNIAFY